MRARVIALTFATVCVRAMWFVRFEFIVLYIIFFILNCIFSVFRLSAGFIVLCIFGPATDVIVFLFGSCSAWARASVSNS